MFFIQALDYMRAGGGLPPHFPPPPGHPLNGHSTQLTNGPGGPINASSLAGLAAVSAAAAAQAASAGRPTSTPTTPSSNAFGGKYLVYLSIHISKDVSKRNL